MSKQRIKTEWNLKPLGKNDQDPRFLTEREKAELAFKKFARRWQKNQDYLKDPKILRRALDEYENLMAKYKWCGDEGYYFWLKNRLREDDVKIKARKKQVSEFAIKLFNKIQFFTINLSKVAKKDQGKFLKAKELQKYRHFLERTFEVGVYTLSDEEERILNLKSGPAKENWKNMLSEFLAKEEVKVLKENGKKEKATFAEIMSLISSNKKRVRDNAAGALNEILIKHLPVAEWELNSILEDKKINDELRGYKRADLSMFISDDISPEVVDTLVETVTKQFKIAKKFYQFKAQLLKQDKLAYHERNVPYGKIEKKYTYLEAINITTKAFSRLDSEFVKIFNDFHAQGQVDVFPKKGKGQGAFCIYWLKTNPVHIFLNYTGDLRNITTLAHEFGHAINFELMKKQHSLNLDMSLAVAEVASTFMEDFVFEEILAQSDDEEFKLTVMQSKLNDDISTIFRQIASINFERELHQNYRKSGYLSASQIGKLFKKHMRTYMGPAVEQSPGSENWWLYWSHLRAYFYNYSYASGLLISKAMQRKYRENPEFIHDIKEFLSTGSSKSPQQAFDDLGIDITSAEFWQTGLVEVEDLLKETRKLAKKLGKIK